MKNLKNRKKLSISVIALSMVFLVGAAFAFTPGVLTVGGTVNLDPDTIYVVWAGAGPENGNQLEPTVSGLANAPTDPDNPTTNIAVVEDTDRDRQQIEWTIDFGSAAGSATLTARAFNRSPVGLEGIDANITRVTTNFTTPIAANWDALGLEVTVDDAEFLGLLEAGDFSDPLTVTVTWDGSAASALINEDDPELTFLISWDYVATS